MVYELEIETKNKIKRIKNPRKARVKDGIFFDILQVMDGNGKWNTICCFVISYSTQRRIVDEINKAIKEKEKVVCIDI